MTVACVNRFLSIIVTLFVVVASVAGCTPDSRNSRNDLDASVGLAAYSKGDYDTAYRIFHSLADAGVPEAQYNIGLMYLEGRGVEKDTDVGREWITQAAEHGYARSQFHLAHIYNSGVGVSKDSARAASWYLRAAKQGYREAQIRLACVYVYGKGVKRDFAEAMFWEGVSGDFAGAQWWGKQLESAERAAVLNRIANWSPILEIRQREYLSPMWTKQGCKCC